MTTADRLWAACVEDGIDDATREHRATRYIDHVLGLDRAEQRAEVLALIGGDGR